MKSILFLEGPVQTGKSTLIREILGSRIEKCGGFTSQRLIDDRGRTRGFRIGAAATTPLTAPWKDPLTPSDAALSGIFKYFDPDGTVHKNQSVFDDAAARYLIPGSGPLILLDEIGGSELLCQPFRRALYQLLSQDTPCLGVLKLADSARRMQRSYGFRDDRSPCRSPSILDRNLELRRLVTEKYNGGILFYERTECGRTASEVKVREQLTRFIDNIF